jgi:hypothetical protein
MNLLKSISLCLVLLGCLTVRAETLPPAPDPTLYAPEQLRADLRFIQDSIAATHPDPGFSADLEKLKLAYRRIDAQLDRPMTRDQAWRLLATLNPVYADGHMALTQGDSLGMTASFLKAGGALFPFEVTIDAAGALTIRSELGGGASTMAGARIAQIDGVPAGRLVAEMLARCHGDTAAFRADLLSTRWPFLYWKMYGAHAAYDVLLENGKHLRTPAASRMPAYLAGAEEFEHQFRFALLPGDAALLTINTFYWPDKKRFTDFTEQAFTQLRDAGIKTLLIDVRANGGGNDDMWIDGILRYVADKPYRWASSYKKKVIKGRDSATEKLGAIIDGEISNRVQPHPDDPLHFSGATYLLVGRSTYSSAVLFSNVMQDFGFATVVGAAGTARTRQSGGMQNFVLPNTGLGLGVPRLILQRPSGNAVPVLLQPDMILPDSPYDQQALIDAVLKLRR